MEFSPVVLRLPSLLIDVNRQVFSGDQPRGLLRSKSECRYWQLLACCRLLCLARGKAEMMSALVDRYMATAKLCDQEEQGSTSCRDFKLFG